MKKIIESLLEWKENGMGYPTQAQIHLTNYCNLKCFFCPTRALVEELDRNKELTRKQWLRVVEEGNELGVQEWHICGGGEPMFFTKDALAVMEAIKNSQRYGEIISNGTFFDKETAKKIVKMDWDKIYISLDAPDPEIHNSIRGVNCFKRIIKGIKNITKFKEEFGKEKPYLYFHMVICNKNYKTIFKMVKLAKTLRVQGISINALNIWKPEVNKLKLNQKQKKELKKILEKANGLSKDFGISVNFKEFSDFTFVDKSNVMDQAMKEEVKKIKKDLSSVACYYPWYNISIFADGRTLPCFILKDEGGNIKEKSLKDIWFGEYFGQIRQSFLENELKKDCQKCNPWNLPKMKKIRRFLNEKSKK